MNKVPDRAKMRREYVRKKGTAGARVIGFAVVTVFALFCCVICILSRQQSPWLSMWAVFALQLAVGTVICGYMTCKAAKEAKSLPYVPPVREQLPSLPAEEVLLRGSQAQTDSPEELLRPAGSEGTKAEELLRASAEK